MILTTIATVATIVFVVALTVYAGVAAARVFAVVPDEMKHHWNADKRTRSQQHLLDAGLLLALFAAATGVAGVVYVVCLAWRAMPDNQRASPAAVESARPQSTTEPEKNHE